MRRLTFLLRPSWLILAVLVAAFAYLCFTVLAPWQLGKNTTTSHRNQLIADSVDAAPIDIATVLDDQSTDSPAEWRRVTATGSYTPNSTVLVRLRHLDGAPGYSVLATFKLDNGRILLIDRGLVAAVDGSRPPQIPDPPAGPQKIEARIRMSEGVTPGKDPMVQDGYRQVYSVDTTQEMTVLQEPLTAIPTGERGGYLQLSENQPGAFTPTPSRNSTRAPTSPTACNGWPSASWLPSASATSSTPRSASAARKRPRPPRNQPRPKPQPPHRHPPTSSAWPTATAVLADHRRSRLKRGPARGSRDCWTQDSDCYERIGLATAA